MTRHAQNQKRDGGDSKGTKSASDAPIVRSRANDLLPRLRLEMRRIDCLHFATRQVRTVTKKHIRDVANSIRAHGLCVPLIISSDGEIVDGHVISEAARSLGLDSVPCVVIDHLSPVQVRTLRLAINRLQEKGEWDLPALNIEFRSLIELNVDMSTTGFEIPEIDHALHFGAEENEACEGLDEAANTVPEQDGSTPIVTMRGVDFPGKTGGTFDSVNLSGGPYERTSTTRLHG